MTRHWIHRRRFLQIAAAVPLSGLTVRAQAAAPVARWSGTALGASSQIILSGMHPDEAAPIFAQVRDEIARLEGVFSLYQRNSKLSLLNKTGFLAQPAPELLEVLSLSRAVWDASQGAFDPAVQPLWRARAQGGRAEIPQGDFGDVQYSVSKIELKPGMQLTFNGIAQGYITDRIADLLSANGLTNLVVDAGELRALGQRPAGGSWRAGVSDPAGALLTRLTLKDKALATSSPGGTMMPDGQGHIIDARSGAPTHLWKTISITDENAAIADALSTAACCLNAQETDAMLLRFPTAKLAFRT